MRFGFGLWLLYALVGVLDSPLKLRIFVVDFETLLLGVAPPDYERFFHVEMTPLFTELFPYVYKRVRLGVLSERFELRLLRRCHVLRHLLYKAVRVLLHSPLTFLLDLLLWCGEVVKDGFRADF